MNLKEGEKKMGKEIKINNFFKLYLKHFNRHRICYLQKNTPFSFPSSSHPFLAPVIRQNRQFRNFASNPKNKRFGEKQVLLTLTPLGKAIDET